MVGAVHLSRSEKAALDAFALGARKLCGDGLHDLRLYGSRARGEGHEESDLDIFVLLAMPDKEKERALDDLAADLSVDTGLLLAPRVWAAEQWQQWLVQERPLACAIRDEGIPL